MRPKPINMVVARLHLLPQDNLLQSPPKLNKNPPSPPNPKSIPIPRNLSPSLLRLRPFTSLKILAAPLSRSPKTPIVLDSGLRFREMLLYIDDLGVDFSKALLKNPSLRSASVDSVKAVERCLSSMGIERSAFGRILDMYPQVLTSDPFRDLYPVFDFLLNDVGIPYPSIRRSIIRCPRLLVCSVDHQLRPALRFLRVLGFVGRKAITFRTTMLLVSSVRGTLAPKIEYLEGLGLGHGQVVKMVLRSPGLLTYSIRRNLLPKVEYFTREMKGDVKELKRFPQYFSFSLDGKIRPRHRILEKHGLVLPLSDMLTISDAEFKVRLLELQLQSVNRGRL